MGQKENLKNYPDKISDTSELIELLSRPSMALIEMMKRLEGDILFLGIGGKMGPTIIEMAMRASKIAKVKRKFIGVSRFSNALNQKLLEDKGIETIKGDLLDKKFIESIPKVKNVIFLVGTKFGASDNLANTWAINTYIPAIVANAFKSSRIVALSTGCVYKFETKESGGSIESDIPLPIGEYAQSCLGRERMFEYGSIKHKTPIVIIRLNYAIETRYGVLVDIAKKVYKEQPVNIATGYFNAIWQTEANEMILRSLELCESPAKILNITGKETISVKDAAIKFGSIFNKKIKFHGNESDTAYLSNASLSHKMFGEPKIDYIQMIDWIADWIINDQETLDKPTRFEVKDGKY